MQQNIHESMQAPSQVSLFSPVPSDFFAWPPRSPSPATSAGGSHHEQQGLSSNGSRNDRELLHNEPSYQHAQLNHYYVPEDSNGIPSNNGMLESQAAMEQDTEFQLDPEMVYLDAARLGVELEIELGRQENDNKAIAAHYQQQLDGQQIHYPPHDPQSANSDSTHHEHDDHDYHPEKEQRGSKSSAGRQKKEGGPRMGRPKDYVWSFFQETLREDNGKHIAKCKACGWTAEWPKAFKIRVHLLACPDTPQNIKDAVQHMHDQQVECRENKNKEPKAAKRQYRKQNKDAPSGKKAKHDHPEESGASSNGDAIHHDYSTDEGRRPSLTMSMSAISNPNAANNINGSDTSNNNSRQSMSHPTVPIFSHQPGSAGYRAAPETKTINPQSTQLAPSSHDKPNIKTHTHPHQSTAPHTSLPPITTSNYHPAPSAPQTQQTSASGLGLHQQQYQQQHGSAIFSNHSVSSTFPTSYQPTPTSSLGTSPQSLPPLPPLASPDGSTAQRKRASSHSHESLTSPELLQSAPAMAHAKRSPITCHVLDSSAGRPGANIKVRMDQLGPTGFSHVASGETDSDGRNGTLMAAGTAIDKNSIFKLTFYTREYFNAKNIKSFYPFVEVVFEVSEPTEHHHIALLLSPFSFTTYRGS